MGGNDPYDSAIVQRAFLAFGAFAIALSPLAAVHAVDRFVDAGRSRSWPTAEGTITRSRLEKVFTGKGQAFWPRIAYSYEVDGAAYEGSRISTTDFGRGKELAARKVLERYPVHSTHVVYYDPGNPAEGLLEPGVSARNYLLLAMPFPMFGFGSAMVWSWWSWRRRRRRATTQSRMG